MHLYDKIGLGMKSQSILNLFMAIWIRVWHLYIHLSFNLAGLKYYNLTLTLHIWSSRDNCLTAAWHLNITYRVPVVSLVVNTQILACVLDICIKYEEMYWYISQLQPAGTNGCLKRLTLLEASFSFAENHLTKLGFLAIVQEFNSP